MVAPIEARVPALLAGGATTARAARETRVTVDGVNYHLRRLSARWCAANRTELVAPGLREGRARLRSVAAGTDRAVIHWHHRLHTCHPA